MQPDEVPSFESLDAGPDGPENATQWTVPRLLRLWLGLREEVGRGAYIASGIGLTVFKYALEASLIAYVTGQFYSPLAFLSPLLLQRTAYLTTAPSWVGWFQFLLTIICEWIAVSMSVRRASNAGIPASWGLFVLLPFVNYVVMLVLSLLRTAPNRERFCATTEVGGVDSRTLGAAARAVIISLTIGGLLFAFSVYTLNTYGAGLFMGTPLMMGVLAGYFYNRPKPSGYLASMGVGLLALWLAIGLLLARA